MTGSVAMALLGALAAGAALMELALWSPRRSGRASRRRRLRGGANASGGAGSLGASVNPQGLDGRPRWAAPLGGDARLDALLDAAGRKDVPDVAALAVRVRLGGVVGAVWGAAAGVLVLSASLPMLLALAGVGGGLGRSMPLVLVRRVGRRRGAHLRDESPEVLDLLAVGLAGGLPIRAALEEAARWTEGEMSVGLERAAADLAHGSAMGATLARLVREFPSPELEAAVAILERSRIHGTPAAEPLRALASGARHARARRAMEHAARAAPRVQLVSALLLVPAALCVLAASLMAGGAA